MLASILTMISNNLLLRKRNLRQIILTKIMMAGLPQSSDSL